MHNLNTAHTNLWCCWKSINVYSYNFFSLQCLHSSNTKLDQPIASKYPHMHLSLHEPAKPYTEYSVHRQTRIIGLITSLPPTFLLLVDLYFVVQWCRHPWRIIKWLPALLLHIIANLKIISNSIRLTCVIYYAVLFPIKNSGWVMIDAKVPSCMYVFTKAWC